MAGRLSSDQQEINEINVTPFVDIMLVLLIIFMVSTPAMLARGMKIQLPKVDKSNDMSHVTLHLLLDAQGNLALESRPISMPDLKAALTNLQSKKMVTDALVAADAVVPHGKVMELVDFLKSNGIEEVGFGVKPK